MKLLILACLVIVHYTNACCQEVLIDYNYVYTLRGVQRLIGGYDYSEFEQNPVKSIDSVSIYITDVNGTAINTSMYLMVGKDTLCIKSDTTGLIIISRQELAHYNNYYIPERFTEYEKLSGPLMNELHSPLDWNVLMSISSLHIVMKTWDVPADYYLFSKTPLTENQIDELRKDIIFNTKISPMYDSVYIYATVKL